jgi:hypothetical protein
VTTIAGPGWAAATRPAMTPGASGLACWLTRRS